MGMFDGFIGAGCNRPKAKSDAPARPEATRQITAAAGGANCNSPTPVSAGSAESLPPNAKPYAKGAGYHVPPGTATGPVVAGDVTTQRLPSQAEIPVRAYVRGAAAPKEELEPTAELIVEECGKRCRRSTRDALYIGSLVYRFILRQPERPADAQFGRKGALEHLRARLLAARLDEGSCRVDRDLRCYHLMHAFGGDSKGVNISVIRSMLPLLAKEEGKERPGLKAPTAEAAKILWVRAVNERLTAAAVRAEVLKLLPAKRPSDDRRHKSRQAVTVLRLIPLLSAEERRKAMRALRAADAAAKNLPAANQPAAA